MTDLLQQDDSVSSHRCFSVFDKGIDAQMEAGLDHEIRLDLEIGPITIYFILEYETLKTNLDNELMI